MLPTFTFFFFFQAEDGIRDLTVTGVQTCALPIFVGVIGPNGAGKTTLFRMIVGQETPDGGSLRVGETVVPAHVDQNRDALDNSKTVFEEITGGHDTLVLG